MADSNQNCCTSGGRVFITVNGKKFSARTAATIEWTQYKRDVVTNQDGTISITVKAMAPTAKFTLSNKCGLKLTDLDQCSVDATFDMVDARKKFYFTGATTIGRPALNTETGEISGMEIVAPTVTITDY